MLELLQFVVHAIDWSRWHNAKEADLTIYYRAQRRQPGGKFSYTYHVCENASRCAKLPHWFYEDERRESLNAW